MSFFILSLVGVHVHVCVSFSLQVIIFKTKIRNKMIFCCGVGVFFFKVVGVLVLFWWSDGGGELF